MDWKGSNEDLSAMRSVIRTEQSVEHSGSKCTKILRPRMYAGGEEAATNNLPELPCGVFPEVKAVEVLQPEMFRIGTKKGKPPALSLKKGERKGNIGASVGDATTSRPKTSDSGTCPPQEWHQDGQPPRKLGDNKASGARAFTQSSVATSNDAMLDLWNYFHAAQNQAWAHEYMLTSVPGSICARLPMGFIEWFLNMRGALSRLPTAYGPWIWQPPMGNKEPKQIDMFGENT